MMDEAKLIEKLKLIEALFAGATTPGERVAADAARQRILARLKSFEVADPPVEFKFTLADVWSRRVLLALLRRYDLRPYRFRGQRHTTVMVKVSKGFVDETLWPQFQEISETLRTYLSDVTDRVVSQVLHQDSSEAAVVVQPPQLPISTSTSEPAVTPPGPSVDKSAETDGGTRPKRGPGKERRKKRKKKRRR